VPERESQVVALVIYIIEAPVLVIIAVALMCGLYSPYDIPVNYCCTVYTPLSGCSFFTTLVVTALFLREEYKISMEHSERRPIFEYERLFLAVVDYITIGLDIYWTIPVSTAFYTVHRTPLQFLVMVVAYVFFQTAIACYFLYQAANLTKPLYDYLNQVAHANSESQRKLLIFCGG